MKRPTRHTRSLHILLLAALSACATPTLHGANRLSLDLAQSNLNAGQYGQLRQVTNALIFSTQAHRKEYRLQRGAATYLAAQASLQELLDLPSTREIEVEKGESWDPQLSPAARCMRELSYGLDWLPEDADEQALRDLWPVPLAELGPLELRHNLELTRLALLGRLGFSEDPVGISTSLANLESCLGRMESCQFPAEARPWVQLMIFEELRGERPSEAYRFAAQALFKGLPGPIEDQLRVWIGEDSGWEFRCPKTQHLVDLGQERCPDGIPIVEFVPKRKRR